MHTSKSEPVESVSRAFLLTVLGAMGVTSLLAALFLLVPSTIGTSPGGSPISFARLLAATPPLLGFAAVLGALLWLARTPRAADIFAKFYAERSQTARFLERSAAFLLLSGLLILCIPAYALGQWAGYIEQLRPLLAWAVCQCLIGLLAAQYSRRLSLAQRLRQTIGVNASLLKGAAIVLALLILTWGVIAATRLASSGREDYWYEAGVPILPIQFMLAIAIAIAFNQVEARLRLQRAASAEVILFFGIWLITAAFWAAPTAPPSYFNTAPRPPTRESFPFSDAAGYDLRAQFALIGQGLGNGQTDDNPLYPAFLVLAHLVGGQNYQTVMAIQAAVLAVLPAIIYLLSRQVTGRATSVGAAALAAFRGWNAIAAAGMINLASPKQMLTDFPAAVVVALILLLSVRLVRGNGDGRTLALWLGAAIALGFLVRQTVVILVGLVPLAVWAARTSRRQMLYLTALACAAFALTLAPWGVRNATKGRNPVDVYLAKFRYVSRTRQQIPTPRAAASASALPDDESAPQSRTGTLGGNVVHFAPIMASHFAHGLLTTALILPTSPILDDLRHAIKAPDAYWVPYWAGELSWWRSAFLLLGLAVVALGISSAWTRHRFAGLVPLVAFLLYQLANALGRTSGGRYIVPVDWILGLYLVLGLSEAFRLAGSAPGVVEKPNGSTMLRPWATALLPALALTVLLGSLPVAVELPFPLRYSDVGDTTSNGLPAKVAESLARHGYSEAAISSFLLSDGSSLQEGRLLYPRYFTVAAAMRPAEDSLVVADFPRLEFSLIGPSGQQIVVLPGTKVPRVKNASDVFVIGCDQGRTLDAAFVISADGEGVSVREPASPLSCPLSSPICDASGTCR